jgi:antitoxin (DNA-binding transcriptional repressor) of toxin-antitoxin stability system
VIISATEFKAKCLQILERVRATGERVQVTKRGKVIAELGPPTDESARFAKAGFAKGEMRILGDVIEPTGAEWESLK